LSSGAWRDDNDVRPPAWRLLLAYAAIYFLWGSTYLAIKWAVETVPPSIAMGGRSVVAGLAMLAIAFVLRVRMPTPVELASSALVGFLFFACNQGLLATAQTRLPSGVAALLIATTPFFVPLIVWALGGGRPGVRVVLGVGVGLAGVGVLVNGGAETGMADPLYAAITLAGAFCWGLGTVLATRLPRPPSLLATAGCQLLFGGCALLAIGFALGHAEAIALEQVSLRSLAGIAYLLVFGTFCGFGAFVWLTRHEPPTRISTYAFVNPVVAVLIGHFAAGEPLTVAMLLAMAAIVGAVVLIVTDRAGVQRR
jgi:drug/metabolite transporter (DMT)-like permease